MNTLEDLLVYSSIGGDGEHQSSKNRWQWSRCFSTVTDDHWLPVLHWFSPKLGIPMYIERWSVLSRHERDQSFLVPVKKKFWSRSRSLQKQILVPVSVKNILVTVPVQKNILVPIPVPIKNNLGPGPLYTSLVLRYQKDPLRTRMTG